MIILTAPFPLAGRYKDTHIDSIIQIFYKEKIFFLFSIKICFSQIMVVPCSHIQIINKQIKNERIKSKYS